MSIQRITSAAASKKHIFFYYFLVLKFFLRFYFAYKFSSRFIDLLTKFQRVAHNMNRPYRVQFSCYIMKHRINEM